MLEKSVSVTLDWTQIKLFLFLLVYFISTFPSPLDSWVPD